MPLSRDEVLARALSLLDEAGIEALTMRRLAAALGVQPGALYWHFKSKQELQDAMAEAMLASISAAGLVGRWDERMAELARRMLAAVSRYRDGARVASQALKPGPRGLQLSEVLLGILHDSGLPARESMAAAATLSYYVLGSSVDLQAMRDIGRPGMNALLRWFRQQLDPGRYPHLAAISDQTLRELITSRDAKARFEFGLQLILDGIKSAARARRAATARRRKARRR